MKPIVGLILTLAVIGLIIGEINLMRGVVYSCQRINAMAEYVGVSYVPSQNLKIPGKYYGD